MRILVVAATAMELAPIVERLGRAEGPAQRAWRTGDPIGRGPRMARYECAGHRLDLLVTGVGMVATAAWCSRALAEAPYDLGVNVGVCGSFDPGLELGSVVHVVSDRLAELGAEDGDGFLSIDEIGLLPEPGARPGDAGGFWRAELVNPAPPSSAALSRLPPVKGITVNTVHGDARSIAAVVRRFRPQVESMEGAAFMYSCMIRELPFAQVRAVSNAVEPRNREAWKMADATRALGDATIAILETL